MQRTVEFNLVVSNSDEKIILKLLDKGRHLYNLALSECRKRLALLREDLEYQSLLSQRKAAKKSGEPLQKLNAALKTVRTRYGLDQNGIEKFVKAKGGYLLEDFNSQFAQVLAGRAVKAIERVIFGKARRVRFKGKCDNLLDSLQSKSTDTGFFFNTQKGALTHGKVLSLPLVETTGDITGGISIRSSKTSKNLTAGTFHTSGS